MILNCKIALVIVDLGCVRPDLAANGKCNDISNTEACLWDNGDCCTRIISESCLVCICHLDGLHHPRSYIINSYNQLEDFREYI